jgi:hypothetical protein
MAIRGYKRWPSGAIDPDRPLSPILKGDKDSLDLEIPMINLLPPDVL